VIVATSDVNVEASIIRLAPTPPDQAGEQGEESRISNPTWLVDADITSSTDCEHAPRPTWRQPETASDSLEQ
jgi:hypothetical protein